MLKHSLSIFATPLMRTIYLFKGGIYNETETEIYMETAGVFHSFLLCNDVVYEFDYELHVRRFGYVVIKGGVLNKGSSFFSVPSCIFTLYECSFTKGE